jgi:HEAT repeat protein
VVVRRQAAVRLVGVLRHDRDGGVKVKAARALARLGKGAADRVPDLQALPPADDPLVKAEVEHALAVIRFAVKVARPIDAYQQLAAQKAEGLFPQQAKNLSASKREELQTIYDAMKDSPVAGECPEAVQTLLDAAGRTQISFDKETREQACAHLVALVKRKKVNTDSVVPGLVEVIDRPGGLAAIAALGELGPDARAAVQALKALETDPHRSVREAASQALAKIEKP